MKSWCRDLRGIRVGIIWGSHERDEQSCTHTAAFEIDVGDGLGAMVDLVDEDTCGAARAKVAALRKVRMDFIL